MARALARVRRHYYIGNNSSSAKLYPVNQGGTSAINARAPRVAAKSINLIL